VTRRFPKLRGTTCGARHIASKRGLAPAPSDRNRDGQVNNFDIDPFVAVLTGH